MVCYGCFAFFLLLGGLLDAMAGYYPFDMDHSLVINTMAHRAGVPKYSANFTHVLWALIVNSGRVHHH